MKLRVPHPELAQLHPAQLADPVEAASHAQGTEIMRAVGPELEADVLGELDEQHRIEFIEARSDENAANVIARMASDDAADLLASLDEPRREAILALLPAGAAPGCARCWATTPPRPAG